MMKILIVDDEPIVQAGISVMINCQKLDMTVCGTASNGLEALDIIRREQPDIVISDIKMPQMSGMELVKICREQFGNLPVFIILTSYEEFSLAREAISYEVSDYLVKLDLNEHILEESLLKAAAIAARNKNSAAYLTPDTKLLLNKEKFYIRLIHNLFENEEQFRFQCHGLNIDLAPYEAFAVCYISMSMPHMAAFEMEQQMRLYMNAAQMVKQLYQKYIPCDMLLLDMEHLVLILFLEPALRPNWEEYIRTTEKTVSDMIFDYYKINMLAAVGQPVNNFINLCDSFHQARTAMHYAQTENPIVFSSDALDGLSVPNTFNIAIFREAIRHAYEEYDQLQLEKTIHDICSLLREYPSHFAQAMDAASNILYLSTSLLENGESLVSHIFSDVPGGYYSLYSCTKTAEIVRWLDILCKGLCESLASQNKEHKNYIVTNVKLYIKNNIHQKLLLNEVAAAFGISPNYLSSIFHRYTGMGFNEYITAEKVNCSKQYLKNGDFKIYEVANKVGYDNQYYFSKVFKKITGITPIEYRNKYH